MARRKIQYKDKEIEVREVDFAILKDSSIVVETNDGAKIRVKPIIVSILRTDERDENGDRVYIVQNFTHITLEEPATEDRREDGKVEGQGNG